MPLCTHLGTCLTYCCQVVARQEGNHLIFHCSTQKVMFHVEQGVSRLLVIAPVIALALVAPLALGAAALAARHSR